MEKYIGKNRGDNTTLRCPAMGAKVTPVVQIASFQELLEKCQKFVISDPLTQEFQQQLVVNVVEVTFDINITYPFCSFPTVSDFF